MLKLRYEHLIAHPHKLMRPSVRTIPIISICTVTAVVMLSSVWRIL